MHTFASRTCLLALAVALLTSPAVAEPPPIPAGADGALWEVMESMTLAGSNRRATAALAGEFKAGTPLCPVTLSVPICFVNVIASDSIRIQTGKGTITGDFQVVQQGDNQSDGSEQILLSGTLRADIELLSGTPLADLTNGSLRGIGAKGGPLDRVVVRADFTGTFRLPFLGDGGVPSYLVLTPGGPVAVPVPPNEMSLGSPTVRLEINFLQ